MVTWNPWTLAYSWCSRCTEEHKLDGFCLGFSSEGTEERRPWLWLRICRTLFWLWHQEPPQLAGWFLLWFVTLVWIGLTSMLCYPSLDQVPRDHITKTRSSHIWQIPPSNNYSAKQKPPNPIYFICYWVKTPGKLPSHAAGIFCYHWKASLWLLIGQNPQAVNHSLG